MAKKRTGRRENHSGSIYRDGDGYRVQVLLGYNSDTGKAITRKVRAKSQDEAVDALKKLQAEQSKGRAIPSSGASVGDYLNHWLASKIQPMRAPSTYRQYAWLVNDHIAPLLGKKRLDKVGRADVQVLINAKSQQIVKPKDKDQANKIDKRLGRQTLRLIRAVLHAAYQDAIRDGVASHNPASFVELPKEKKQPPKFLAPEEVVRLFEAAKDMELSELLRFMVVTGTRLGEATGIRWQDVDLIAGTVRIAGQLQRLGGKLEYKPSTKTNQDRSLPLGKDMVEALQDLKSRQMIEGWEDPDGIVFLNPYGRRVDAKYLWKLLRKTCERAGIPAVSPHKLRHTAATLGLAETGDLHAVQKMLGHQQGRLTSDLYGHATAERLRPLSDAIERAVKGISKD